MTPFRLGFHFSNYGYEGVRASGVVRHISNIAVAAESAGFDAIWVPDHGQQGDIGGGPSSPMFEAYTLLGALASVTKRAYLGALVSPVTFRPPALLAKAVTSLDVISGGRALCGLGAAWDVGEHAALGVSFPALGERQDRLEEAAQICRSLFTETESTFAGRFHSVEGAFNSPRPIQARIPILIGGSGERRTLRAVARYADACNLGGEPAVVARKLEVLDQHCQESGRDVSDIARTCLIMPPAGGVGELVTLVSSYVDVGITGVVLLGSRAPDEDTVSGWGQALAALFSHDPD